MIQNLERFGNYENIEGDIMINYRCIEVKDKEEIYEILLEMRDYFLDGIRRTNQELYESYNFV